jgi:hypothetical protein
MTSAGSPSIFSRARQPRHRSALSIVVIACVMGSLFAASYSLALGRATPHHIPTALVGGPAQSFGAAHAIEQVTHGALRLDRYPSIQAAERAIAQQREYAALDLASTQPQLLIASASGASVARVLTQAAGQLQRGPVPSLAVRDVHPLPRSDPQGLVSFYVTLASTIIGFVSMFQLRAHASMGLREWLLYVLLLAVAGGLALTLVTGPIIGALHGPFGEIWAALALEIAVAALVCSVLIVLVGRWAILPTWLLFVVLGNASSGGAVAPPLLPPFYAFIGRFLPPGATVDTIRSAVYFPHSQHLEPVLVELGWLVCALAALIAAARVLGREPGRG